MDKTYQPANIENTLYKQWESKGYFSPSGVGDPYCIMIPPPNVTGSLHMGHGFQESIMDALVRFHRMRGHNTLWQVGTDHAGIATQMVVERLLDAEGTDRHALGRDAFIERVWDWKETSGGNITRQLRRLGSSIDWSRERFTMDEGFYKAVQEVFVTLYDDKLIYRGKRLVNWDPKLHTAISDLEVVSEETKGHMWHFRYPLADGTGHVVVATTRPETMLGDSAVAVDPNDERYQHLIGRHILLPLADREIPIIADDYVDKDFGTGCVKITPAHDFNDYEVGKRHQLPMINIFTDDAALNNRVPEKYRGMDRFKARDQIVADLDALGLLEKVEDHLLKVPKGDRSGVVVEPYLTNQWYVRTQALADDAIKAVEDGDIAFVPKQYENMYFSWMRDIQDWCISRQLWWGHRIPAWYDDQGNVYVARNEKEVRQKYQLDDAIQLTQDNDVLDTWFSSGLWTFGTLGWPENSDFLKTFHPTSTLVTGFDIIFFWVARMIMLTLYFKKEVPFKTVYVHGLVRDSHGQKMSKSKGNVLDPIDLIDGIDLESLVAKRTAGMQVPKLKAKIEKQTRKEFAEGIAAYGTDALRYTYYSLASTGRDINFDVGRIEGFRNFCNKLWNASNYVLMNTEGKDCGQNNQENYQLTLADRWIISRLQEAEKAVIEGFQTYRLDLASQALYDFIWKDYCDWYLELTKPVLWNDDEDPEILRGTRRTLVRVLEATLRMAHPLMPFITEEIWQRLKALASVSGETIMLAPYPQPQDHKIDSDALVDIKWLQSIILSVRKIREEMNVAKNKMLDIFITNGEEEDQRRLTENTLFLSKLASLSSVTWLNDKSTLPLTATSLVGELEVHVPLAGIIDKETELKRLAKELDKLSQEIDRINGKLRNVNFVDKAPKAVVDKEKQRLNETKSGFDKLKLQMEKIQVL